MRFDGPIPSGEGSVAGGRFGGRKGAWSRYVPGVPVGSLDLDVELAEPCLVKGRVVLPDGSPFTWSFRVEAYRDRPRDDSFGSFGEDDTFRSEDGVFAWDMLTDGPWRIRVTASRGRSGKEFRLVLAGSPPEELVFELTEAR